MSLEKLLKWAVKEFGKDGLFLMGAGSNSFEIHRRLLVLGLRAVVMKSCHVGRHAKTYADNDKLAAARIALVYLQGNAPCVWVPAALTCERGELLHAYHNAVASHVAAANSPEELFEPVRGAARQPLARIRTHQAMGGRATRLDVAPA